MAECCTHRLCEFSANDCLIPEGVRSGAVKGIHFESRIPSTDFTIN